MKLVLKQEQKPHVQRLVDILTKNFAALDLSIMGAGKTYTATAVAKEFDFEKVLVICPASVVSKWMSMKRYGLKLYDVISYESLRSVKGKNPRHGLLTRIDEGSRVYFEPTPELNALTKAGIFVILDEAQRIKNKVAQWYSCKAIAEAILLSGGMSRFILLSGTPIDKEQQAINLMKMLGFIRADKLSTFNKFSDSITLYGAQELIEFCRRIDEEKTNEVLAEEEFTPENVEHICYRLFQNVIKVSITSSMNPTKSDKIFIDVKNAEYTIDNFSDNDTLRKSVDIINIVFERFRKASRFQPGEDNPNENEKAREMKERKREELRKKIELIAYHMHQIENAKINLLIQLAKKKLKENSHNKVALFVNYTSSIEKLSEELQEYIPLILDGSVDKEVRQDVIDEFQEANQKHRLLIGNIRVCSSGIDLDDKSGKFPRFAFAVANLNMLDLQQLPSRFLRLNTKSSTIFRFVYGKKYPEFGLLGNLERKARVMKDTTGDKQVESGVPFVGELSMIDGDEE